MGVYWDTLIAYWRWAATEIRSHPIKRPRRGEGRHLLIFANALPPVIVGGVFRPLSLLRYGADFDWRVTAIAESSSSATSALGQALLEHLPDSSRIVRYHAFPLKPSWRLFPRVDGGFVNSLEMASLARSEFKTFAPDAVLATGPSFHSFIAGYFTANLFDCPLILDYRDEWTLTPFDYVVDPGNADSLWERRCLKRADRIVFTTASQREYAIKNFGFVDPARCIVIPNGYEPLDERGDLTAESHPGKITIAFVGNLANYSPPGEFLRTLIRSLDGMPALRDDLRVRFVGPRSKTAQRELDEFFDLDLIECVNQVSKSDSIREMRNSSALLILSEPELARYIPGKLYDYLATDRPLLVYGHQGEVSSIVESLGAGFFVKAGDVNGMRTALEQLLKDRDARWSGDERKNWIKKHERKVNAKRFFDEIDLAAKSRSQREGRTP